VNGSLQTKRGLAVRLVRMEMARRGISVSELAEMARFPRRRIANCLCLNDPSWPPRAAINQALGRAFFVRPRRTRRRPVRKVVVQDDGTKKQGGEL